MLILKMTRLNLKSYILINLKRSAVSNIHTCRYTSLPRIKENTFIILGSNYCSKKIVIHFLFSARDLYYRNTDEKFVLPFSNVSCQQIGL